MNPRVLAKSTNCYPKEKPLSHRHERGESMGYVVELKSKFWLTCHRAICSQLWFQQTEIKQTHQSNTIPISEIKTKINPIQLLKKGWHGCPTMSKIPSLFFIISSIFSYLILQHFSLEKRTQIRPKIYFCRDSSFNWNNVQNSKSYSPPQFSSIKNF